MKQTFAAPVSLLALTLLLIQPSLPLPVGARATAGRSATAPSARISEQVSVHTARRGNPWINLADGRSLLTGYEGSQQAAWALEHNRARGLSLASDDFDEDGTRDLVCGYAAEDGSGIVALHRGNVDSIFPNGLEAQARRASGQSTDSPFLGPARVFELPEPAEFLGAGDFDADGHRDVVAASSTEEALYLLKGDGQGGLAEAERIGLPGRVTAMTVGDINRADGLEDIVVGVSGHYGPQALVFEGREGALRREAEAIILPAEATSLAIGQLDDSYEYDLAIAAGSELLIVAGRDRKMMMAYVGPATMSRKQFPFTISSIAIGEFVREEAYSPDIAVMSEDGRAQYLRRGDEWEVMNEVRVADHSPQSDTASRPVLAKVKVSSLATDDLLVIDRASNQIRIVSGGPGSRRPLHETTTLDVAGEAMAVLPMRLNQDALGDLVMLKADSNELAVAMTTPMATLTVTNTADSGLGSLRQAIIDANAVPGLDTISFNIGRGGRQTITPETSLPEITDLVVIDGTTQPGFGSKPIIELSGGRIRTLDNGLSIRGGANVVRGLVINRFSAAIHVLGSANNRFEGCFIGTDVKGSSALGNAAGLRIEGQSNTVGGTEAPAGNLISGNRAVGVEISSFESQENLIQGNRIGTDFAGRERLSNPDGVNLFSGNNVIGGMTEAAGNIISGNDGNGVGLFSGIRGNRVQGNKIGTDISGVFPVPNSRDGVGVTTADNVLIERNTIAFNRTGVAVIEFLTGNVVTANSIHSNKGLGIDLGIDGITANDGTGDGDGGANNLQNFPILNSARVENGSLTIQGILESAANKTFRIEFFANRECDPEFMHGEGETFIGSITVTTDNTGKVEFTASFLGGTGGAGPIITATATDPDGNTSEFSKCILITATLTVITTADSGPGSLRDALGTGGVIDFNIPQSDLGFDAATGTWTISPPTPLPAITRPTFIYGSTQPRREPEPDNKPVIGINGAAITTPNTPGFDILAPGSVVEGIAVYGYTGDGVRIRPPANNVSIIGNLIGLKPDGTIAGNDGNGIRVFSSAFNIIARNVISDSGMLGIAVDNQGASQGARANLIIENLIGTDPTGTMRIGNGDGAVGIFDSPENIIGARGFRNTFASTGRQTTLNGKVFLIGPGTTRNRVEGNLFGTDFTGSINLGNPDSIGVVLDSGAAINLFTDNVFENLFKAVISDTNSLNNFFQQNLISSTVNQPIDRGNNGPDSNLATLSSAAQGNSTRIQGSFRGRPNADYTLEFFSSTICHPSGFGPGEFFVDSTSVTADAAGNADFDVTLDATVPAGHFITTTATNDVDGTTEFSRCVQVSGAARPDVALTKSGPATVPPGEAITYTIEAKNMSQATAFGVMVTDDLPACLTSIFCTTSQGDCDVMGNRVTTNLGSIDPSNSATVTITARVGQNCSSALSNTARVAAAGDTNAANNNSTINTAIRPGPKITSLKLKGGSKLIVTGEGFQSGAKIKLIKPGGAETQVNKTKFNSETKLTGKGVVISPGDRVVIENPGGGRTAPFTFTG